MSKIAVLGHGVVGSGVVEVTMMNNEQIAQRCGEKIEVKRILDIREFPELSYSDKFTKNFDDIVSDEEISVVCEVMGGLSPAYEFTKACLEAGKSVVTSNKELVSGKGAELLKIAKENNVNYFFEASVGGGIPIIRPIHKCLAGNKIEEIVGILNGTTNFILAKMINDNMRFVDALALAQKLGYAEKDPTADIEGDDACRKICILASLAFGNHIYPKDVHKSGITKITLEDVEYVKNWGGEIKLIGRTKMLANGNVFVMLSSAIVSNENPLSGVHGVFNGVMVQGNAVDKVVFIGPGAGKLPTASAVLGDVIDAVKHKGTSVSQYWEDSDENIVENYREDMMRFYIRVQADNPIEAKAYVERNFPDVNYLARDNQPKNEFAFYTCEIKEQCSIELIQEMNKLGIDVLGKIRILD